MVTGCCPSSGHPTTALLISLPLRASHSNYSVPFHLFCSQQLLWPQVLAPPTAAEQP